MSYLFKITSAKAVYPTSEVLMISPFKEIWKRDQSENKEQAIAEFAYIEFMTSMMKTNPYRQYHESKKKNIIRKAVLSQFKDWEEDELVTEAINLILDFQREASTTYQYYIAAKSAAEGMQDFFMNVDLTEKNKRSGNPVYKPRDLTSALNDTAKVLENLKALEKKVEEELYDDVKIRSDKIISYFAKRESMKDKKMI